MRRRVLALLLLVFLTFASTFSQSKSSAKRPIGSESGTSSSKSLANPNTGSVNALDSEKSHAAGLSGEGASSIVPALSSAYRVGPGDVLDISIDGINTRDSTLFTITEEGRLDYPLVGEPFSVAGLTTVEIISALKSRTKLFQGAPFVVNVRDYASHFVIVTGAAINPGSRVLRREAVPLYVLLSDVELSPNAEKVSILRRGQSEKSFNLTDEAGLTTPVVAGDVVRIGAAAPKPELFYYVGGSVRAPGQLRFYEGITVTQAVLAAGGASVEAQTVRISRLGPERKLVSQEFLFKEIQAGKIEDPQLQPGDRVEIGH
jgi:protein involved in polysaccharide export with SLBB domain